VVEAQEEKGSYRAPMPGQVTRILVQPGQEVQKGELLVIFVSMKMENRLQAAEAGKVEAVYVQEGQTVEAGAQLLRILPLP
jgi:biotin carboxyl carrier protein